MIIALDHKVRKAGRVHESTILKIVSATPNYTGLHEPDRFYISYLSEWSFDSYLNKKGIVHKWLYYADGKSHHEPDFIAQGKEIQVKGFRGAYKNHVMTPKKQFDIKIYPYYVGVRISDDETNAKILGYCFPTDFTLDTSQRVPCMKCHIRKLRDLEELWDKQEQEQGYLF